jgi:hypothetical protein
MAGTRRATPACQAAASATVHRTRHPEHKRGRNTLHEKGQAMSSKHPKLDRPTNVDLVRNPGIGSSKGVTMAQASLEDLEDLEGENTFEGDVENDTNPQGGIDKAEVMDRRRGPAKEARQAYSQSPQLQGRKTHEQQLRILERNPDGPDPRHLDQEMSFAKTVTGKPEGGAPLKGKGDGSGAMTDLQDDMLGENEVLSNRDKAESSRERGQDSKWIQTEQREDHSANRGRG